MYCATGSTTFLCSGGAAGDNGLVVYSSAASGGCNTDFAIKNSGNATVRGNLNVSGTITANGDKLNFPNLLNQY